MQRVFIIVCIAMIATALPVPADIGMPQSHTSELLENVGVFTVGIDVQKESGDSAVVIRVYRDGLPYPANESTLMSSTGYSVTIQRPGEGPRPINEVGELTSEASSRDLENFPETSCVDYWRIQAFKVATTGVPNGTWYITATATGLFTYQGEEGHPVTDEIGPVTCDTEFLTENLLFKDTADPEPAQPRLLIWQGETVSAPFYLEDSGPLYATPGPLNVGTRKHIEIYPIGSGTSVYEADLQINSEQDWGLTWNGSKTGGGTADPGLYAYEVTVGHFEAGWSCPSASGEFPFWSPDDCGNDPDDGSFVCWREPEIEGEHDQDARTSSKTVTPNSVEQIGPTSFRVTYTLSDSVSQCGMCVYDGGTWEEVTGTRHTNLSAASGQQTYEFSLSPPVTSPMLVLFALDNSPTNKGGSSHPKPLLERGIAFEFDTTPPSAPSNVFLDHVIPTSREIRGQWDAVTEGGSGLRDYQYQFYHIQSEIEYPLTDWTPTTSTSAVCTLTFDPSISDGKAYYIRVKARDNALNESEGAESAGRACFRARAGYFYYIADSQYNTYLRIWIAGRLSTAASTYSSIMTIEDLYLFPDELDVYDVLIVSCPDGRWFFSSGEISQLCAWARQWHRRMVLIGEHPFSQGANYNGRLNQLVDGMSAWPRFSTSDPIINPPYNKGTCTYFNTSGPSGKPWLFTGVSGLRYKDFGWFHNAYGYWAARIDGTYDYIAEQTLEGRGKYAGIHDCDVFDPSYANISTYCFIRNFCTAFE